MKKFLILTLLLTTMAFAKRAHAQGYDIYVHGGSVSVDGATLSAPLSLVTNLQNDSTQFNPLPATGSFAVQTGNIASGDFQNSATFAVGGTIAISATSATDSVSFNGTITSAAWQSVRLANGIYSYTLTCAIQDSTTGNTGAFVLVTVNGIVANQKFTGSSLINYVNIHLN